MIYEAIANFRRAKGYPNQSTLLKIFPKFKIIVELINQLIGIGQFIDWP